MLQMLLNDHDQYNQCFQSQSYNHQTHIYRHIEQGYEQISSIPIDPTKYHL